MTSVSPKPPVRTTSRLAGLVRHWRIVVLAVGGLSVVGMFLAQRLGEPPDYDFDIAKGRDTAAEWQRYVARTGKADKGRPELARLHDAARARMKESGVERMTAIDALFSTFLERVDYRIKLSAVRLDVDRASFAEVEPKLRSPEADVVAMGAEVEKAGGYECAKGLSAAFAALTGSDVIAVAEDAPSDDARLTLSWSARANGSSYANPHGRRVFPGFDITARMELATRSGALAIVEATETPGPDVDYLTDVLGAGFRLDQDDVASGMVAAACRRLGERLIEELTGQPPPKTPVRGFDDRVKECDASVASACFEVGRRLRDGDGVTADRARALEYLDKGCRASGLEAGKACVAAAELELERPVKDEMDAMDRRAKASVTLDNGCRLHDAEACARRAELELTPYKDGAPPSAYAEGEALVRWLRACDLGHGGACHRAALLVADGRGIEAPAPSPARAAALAARACAAGVGDACALAKKSRIATPRETTISGVTLARGDEVFDVRFGAWFVMHETEVVWVASRQERDAVVARAPGNRARVYDARPEALPPGPRPPTWARTVYAIIPAPPPDASPCPECTADAPHGIFQQPSCPCLPLPP